MVFDDCLTIYQSYFEKVFFLFWREHRELQISLKVHWNPITGSRDNTFNCFLKFASILYTNFLQLTHGSRINDILLKTNIIILGSEYTVYKIWVLFFYRICDTSHPGHPGQNYVMPGKIKHVTFNMGWKIEFLQLKNF
jgi:hypothetical protein